eukprot:scaffold154243_cov18-Tisochrysis_lutea.AAC.2
MGASNFSPLTPAQVPMHELPEEVQERILPMLSPEEQEQLQLQNAIAKGQGVGVGDMLMGAAPGLAGMGSSSAAGGHDSCQGHGGLPHHHPHMHGR